MMNNDHIYLVFTREEIMLGQSWIQRPSRKATVHLTIPMDINPNKILDDREWIDTTTYGEMHEGKASYISIPIEYDRDPPQMKWGDET